MSETPSVSPAWRSIPGPVDRETFLAAQQRQRRGSWRFGALSGAAVAVLGVPLSVLLSPLLLAVALIGHDIAGIFTHLASPFGSLPQQFEHGESGHAVGQLARTPAIVLLLVPGALFLVLCWFGVGRIFRSVGAGADLVAASRPVHADDADEIQLENLVEAVAIAAGLRAPTVRVIDTDEPNAGIAGTSFEDAAVIVTTGLLRQLGRDETEGVVAHLIGAIGAGDLRRARSLETFYATLGLIQAALGVRTVPGAGRAVRLTVRSVSRRGDRAEAERALLDVLRAPPGEARGFLAIILAPLTVTGAAFTFNASVIGDFVLRPLLRGRWRHRVLLADATAVALTRYPDGIAKALAKLDSDAPLPVGIENSSELLVVGPPKATAALGGFHPPITKRMSQLIRIGASVDVLRDAPVRPAPSKLARFIFWMLLSPLIVVFVALMLVAVVMTVTVTMFIVGLYLFIPLGLLHSLLSQAQ